MAAIRKRTTKGGGTRYHVQVRLRGHPAETASFERLTDARKWGQQTESAIREGRYFKTSESKKHTLADAIDRYKRDVLPESPKSRLDKTRHLDWWRSEIGNYSLADVSPALIVECRDRLRAGTTPQGSQRSGSTVNRYLGSLSHVLSIAEREWEWVASNPVKKVARLKEPKGRVRFLSDSERERLLDACRASTSKHLYPVVVLALSSGMRKSEIMRLTWKDVDLERKLITLHDTKNDDRRSVPLVGHAFDIVLELSKIRQINTSLLFPGRPKAKGKIEPLAIRTAWEAALSEAQIEDFRFHDLRHTAASYLAMQGASPSELAAVLGHKTLQMVHRYAHLSPQHTASLVEKMNQRMFGAGTTESTGDSG